MKDISGRELNVGDTVAYCVPNYSKMAVGDIKEIGSKSATITQDHFMYPLITRVPSQISLISKGETK